MNHCSFVAGKDCDLIMMIPCKLVAVILVLALNHEVCTETVIGGRVAAPHSRPYMALVERDHRNGSKKDYCGGFLLSEDFVMTAAHCQAKFFRVRLGLHDVHQYNDGRQHIRVEQAFPHKYYNETSKINDVMILKLKSKAKLNNNVQPIALADWDDKSLPNSCSVSGWGQTKWKEGSMSDYLMELNVTLIYSDWCDQNLYCSEDKTGLGNGDSGGPLVCEDNKAFGVVSTCYKHPDERLLCKFTKIQNHKDWITSTMKKALTEV